MRDLNLGVLDSEGCQGQTALFFIPPAGPGCPQLECPQGGTHHMHSSLTQLSKAKGLRNGSPRASGPVGMREVRRGGGEGKLYFSILIQLLLTGPLLDCGPRRPFRHARLEVVISRRSHHHLYGNKGEKPQQPEACPSSPGPHGRRAGWGGWGGWVPGSGEMRCMRPRV